MCQALKSNMNYSCVYFIAELDYELGQQTEVVILYTNDTIIT
jgi:hypothetical protein